MIYSLQPLEGTIDEHTGFYAVLFVICFLSIMIYIHEFIRSDSFFAAIIAFFKFLFISSATVLPVVGWISWNSGTVYANVPVEATLVSTYESNTIERMSKRNISVASAFVTYMTPDGEVVFKRSEGIVYPKNAILYRN